MRSYSAVAKTIITKKVIKKIIIHLVLSCRFATDLKSKHEQVRIKAAKVNCKTVMSCEDVDTWEVDFAATVVYYVEEPTSIAKKFQ